MTSGFLCFGILLVILLLANLWLLIVNSIRIGNISCKLANTSYISVFLVILPGIIFILALARDSYASPNVILSYLVFLVAKFTFIIGLVRGEGIAKRGIFLNNKLIKWDDIKELGWKESGKENKIFLIIRMKSNIERKALVYKGNKNYIENKFIEKGMLFN